MENLKLTADISVLPMYAISFHDDRKTLDIEAFDGELTVSVQYDFSRIPLQLSAPVERGDRIEMVLMDHRIELYVNGDLRDEEWPYGWRLFRKGDSFTTNVKVECTEYVEKQWEQPAVLGSFENAEGWYPGNGVFVGDCMPYRKKDEYHVLYLKDRHHHGSKWRLGAHQWEHISTKDFQTWNIHPMAVPITDPEEGSICTGSWIQAGGKEYLYYTVRRDRIKPAPICRSVSYDGYHFEKDSDFHFVVSPKYHAGTARDPKVIKGDDGLYHMLLTTSLVEQGRGCLAHYVSADLEKWDEVAQPLYIAPGQD